MTHKVLSILIAEDDPDDRILLKEAFESSALSSSLHFVEDGEQLIDFLHQRGAYDRAEIPPRPGFILLDLNMPKKDGRESLAEIKATPGLRSIPVVVMTTSNSKEDVSHCYDLGANSYITKPAAMSDLVQMIQSLGKYWFEVVTLPASVSEAG
jgi:CheY-like chemotaxis protein